MEQKIQNIIAKYGIKEELSVGELIERLDIKCDELLEIRDIKKDDSKNAEIEEIQNDIELLEKLKNECEKDAGYLIEINSDIESAKKTNGDDKVAGLKGNASNKSQVKDLNQVPNSATNQPASQATGGQTASVFATNTPEGLFFTSLTNNSQVNKLFERIVIDLKYESWDKVDVSIDKILDEEPSNPGASLAQYMCENKIKEIALLEATDPSEFRKSSLIKRTLDNSNRNQQKYLNELVVAQENYLKYKEATRKADSSDANDILAASQLFEGLGGYRDSSVQAEKAKQKIYDIALREGESWYYRVVSSGIEHMSLISGYKDANQKIAEFKENEQKLIKEAEAAKEKQRIEKEKYEKEKREKEEKERIQNEKWEKEFEREERIKKNLIFVLLILVIILVIFGPNIRYLHDNLLYGDVSNMFDELKHQKEWGLIDLYSKMDRDYRTLTVTKIPKSGKINLWQKHIETIVLDCTEENFVIDSDSKPQYYIDKLTISANSNENRWLRVYVDQAYSVKVQKEIEVNMNQFSEAEIYIDGATPVISFNANDVVSNDGDIDVHGWKECGNNSINVNFSIDELAVGISEFETLEPYEMTVNINATTDMLTVENLSDDENEIIRVRCSGDIEEIETTSENIIIE